MTLNRLIPIIGSGTGGFSAERALEIMQDEAVKIQYEGEIRFIRYKRESPVNVITDQFKILLALAVDWAEEQERVILRDGVALTAAQLTDAKRVGVTQPERVRLHVVDEDSFAITSRFAGSQEIAFDGLGSLDSDGHRSEPFKTSRIERCYPTN